MTPQDRMTAQEKIEANQKRIAELERLESEARMKASPPPEMQQTAISFTFAETDELAQLLKVNLFTAQDVINYCRRATTIDLQGIDITLESGLLYRLKSRCEGKPFGPTVKEIVVSQLRSYVGW